MIISLDKKYKTRDGHGVRLSTTSAKPPYPIEGVMFSDHHEISMHWREDGCYGPIPEDREEADIMKEFGFEKWDLVEIPSADG